MTEADERAERITQLIERAGGYLTDAEFRDEIEMRFQRYLQAMADLLVAISMQNQVMIELLTRQQAYDSLSGD
jgi:hypothetical protein